MIFDVEPEGWETRNEICFLQHMSKDYKRWSFEWIPRLDNLCADVVAKWARVHKCFVSSFDFFVTIVPHAILSHFAAERARFSSLL